MIEDDIIEEIRRYRDERARRFNNDVRAMAADTRTRETPGESPLVSFETEQAPTKKGRNRAAR